MPSRKLPISRVVTFLGPYLTGAVVGILILGLLMLPHTWIPMGRFGTFFLFSIALLVFHAFLYCVLLFLDWYIESEGGFMSRSRAFIYGALAYSLVVILYCTFSFGHSIHDAIWFLVVAFPVGGSSFLSMQFIKDYLSR